MKTIKASKETHARLVEIAGKLQTKNGKRKTMEDALVHVLNHYDRSAGE